MKKLSLLLALMLIITTGGVYAAWNYAQQAIEGKEIDLTKSAVQLTTATSGFKKGVVEVQPTNFVVYIDDADGNHVPEVTYQENSYVAIRFVPAGGADQAVKDGAVKMKYWFTLSEPNELMYDGYNGDDKNIYNIIANSEANARVIEAGTSSTDPTGLWEKLEDGSLVYKIPAKDIIAGASVEGANAAISFNDNVKLDNVNAYETFKEALGSGSIVMHLIEVTETV